MFSCLVFHKKLLVLIVLLSTFACSRGLSIKDYLKIREKAIEDEEESFFGEDLQLDEDEIKANKCLMSIKQKETDEGYKNHSRFWPSRSFLDVRSDIEQTETFKLIRRMPKGGMLHMHNGKTASLDFVYENLTTMPNLYVCLENNTVRFRYFEIPNENCTWLLMEDLRKNNPETITTIKKYLSLQNTSTPGYNIDLYLSKFGEMGEAFYGILDYRPAYEKYIYRSLEELIEDNTMYMELRSVPRQLYELNGTIHDPVDSFSIFKRISNEFVATHPGFIGVKIIYTVLRKLDHKAFNKEVESFRRIKSILPDFIVGFDISYFEDLGHPNIYYIDTLLELSNETTFYFHAGETKFFGYPSDENLFEAVLLNSKRIGHGYAITKYPKLLETVKEKDIAIELSPISNQLTGDLGDLRTHPASHLFSKNISMVVSSDSGSFWYATGLSYDFYEAFIGIMSRKADLRSLKQLAINSITYSAMTQKEKEVALKFWNESWIKFVKYLAYEYDCDRNN